MSEDRELMDFIKAKLEGDLPEAPPRFREIMHFAATMGTEKNKVWPTRRWLASLAAASLLVICSFVAANMHSNRPSQERTIANVIDILRVVDGGETALCESSVADMLLAWQDMPYESAVSELGADTMTCL